MLTADLILSTGPCASWPRAHIDRVLDAIGRPATLAAAIDTLARRNWRDVSIFDARLTLCRLASAKHRSVLTEWVVAVTRARASAQRSQYPDAVAEVVATWDRLAAWDRLDIMLDLARRLDEASSRVGGIR